MKVNGSCHCGEIAFEAEVDPALVRICHCIDCQVLTGGAYRVTVPAAAKDFRLLRGTPKVYLKTTADSGHKRRQAFCGTCGTPVLAYADTDTPDGYGLRVGTLAQKAALVPKSRIWCKSELPWSQDVTSIPGVPGQ
ncbi:MAG TPA: GFA family protein [Usitatibacter sp.]